jgi:hypothetical protein
MERPFFKTLSDLETNFFLPKILTIIYGSMQLDELIPNSTLVLLQNVCLFSKPAIPGQKPGFLGHLLLGLGSQMQGGAMTKNKPYM